MTPKLGIIAGAGPLPGYVIAACRGEGRPFHVIALKGFTDERIVADAPHDWIRLGAGGKGIDYLHAAGVRELVMVGPVKRPSLASLRPDAFTAKHIARIGVAALGDEGLLSAIIRGIEAEGFRFIPIDEILASLIAPEGVYGKRKPDARAKTDIRRGVEVARGLGALDVGQGVVVQQGIVLGVEGIEGTDALIRRCAELRRDGPAGIFVKVKKPNQDRRADLPTIGVSTIEVAAAAGLRGVAVEAGGTLVVELDKVVAAADKAGLFVIGVSVDALEAA